MITDFRLKVFKTVADRLSFTKAAEELSVTQPAVTKHINELEKQLGVPLFLRRGNTIALTPKGMVLLDYANTLLAVYGNLNDAFAEDQDVFSGELSVGASTTISQYVIPPVLAKFRKRYPEVGIKLVNGNTEQIEKMIAAGHLDFGLIEGNASGVALHYEAFMNDELVLVTAAANRSCLKEELSAEELRRVPLVIRESGSGTLEVVERALAGIGIPLRSMHIEMQLGSTESIKRYLCNSEAFAFVSVQAILDELVHGKLRVVEVDGLSINRKFSFVSEHGRRSRITDTFKQFCINHYKHRL